MHLKVDIYWGWIQFGGRCIHSLRSSTEKGMKWELELMYTRRHGPHTACAIISNMRWALKVDERLWNNCEYAADELSSEEYERMMHILISHVVNMLGND